VNKGFLNRVVYQIIKETKIDYGQERVYFFSLSFSIPLSSLFSVSPLSSYFSHFFFDHCENVYGLNEEEIDYVWNEYGNIIHDKI